MDIHLVQDDLVVGQSWDIHRMFLSGLVSLLPSLISGAGEEKRLVRAYTTCATGI